ncbi:putative sporulation protein YtaF [Moraxella lacunata]|uniref:Putative manganese efflux pump MntP n=1 Tax=Moraxella lacunata TaxID=477 RepID=A0A378T6G4_MORLA|nr:manganese efflux pump MntP family protein [Moraxella lacunata]STZ55493.1 putative sporulation protein YtaF [Moraxella lacunata]
MNALTLTTLSFGMAMDAFAVAVAKGASEQRPRLWQAVQGGLFFGVVEGLAPFIGYYLGKATESWVQAFDHWVAFGLLGALGVRFIYGAVCHDEQANKQTNEQKAEQKQANTSNIALMLITAIATSVDSVVVGVSLAFLDVNIVLACVLIGLATTVMATGGLYLGNRLGASFGRYAMGVGGVMLIGIGVFILGMHLVEHG